MGSNKELAWRVLAAGGAFDSALIATRTASLKKSVGTTAGGPRHTPA